MPLPTLLQFRETLTCAELAGHSRSPTTPRASEASRCFEWNTTRVPSGRILHPLTDATSPIPAPLISRGAVSSMGTRRLRRRCRAAARRSRSAGPRDRSGDGRTRCWRCARTTPPRPTARAARTRPTPAVATTAQLEGDQLPGVAIERPATGVKFLCQGSTLGGKRRRRSRRLQHVAQRAAP